MQRFVDQTNTNKTKVVTTRQTGAGPQTLTAVALIQGSERTVGGASLRYQPVTDPDALWLVS